MQNSAGGGKNDRKTDGLSIRGKREFSQKSCRNTGGCSGKEKMSARQGENYDGNYSPRASDYT